MDDDPESMSTQSYESDSDDLAEQRNQFWLSTRPADMDLYSDQEDDQNQQHDQHDRHGQCDQCDQHDRHDQCGQHDRCDQRDQCDQEDNGEDHGGDNESARDDSDGDMIIEPDEDFGGEVAIAVVNPDYVVVAEVTHRDPVTYMTEGGDPVQLGPGARAHFIVGRASLEDAQKMARRANADASFLHEQFRLQGVLLPKVRYFVCDCDGNVEYTVLIGGTAQYMRGVFAGELDDSFPVSGDTWITTSMVYRNSVEADEKAQGLTEKYKAMGVKCRSTIIFAESPLENLFPSPPSFIVDCLAGDWPACIATFMAAQQAARAHVSALEMVLGALFQ